MKPEIILLICAGGVLFFLLLVYAVVSIRLSKARQRENKALLQSYSNGSLQKMEYDVAFYERDAFKIFRTGDTARQMTIEEILSDDEKSLEQLTQKAIFSQLEDEDGKILIGRFNSTD